VFLALKYNVSNTAETNCVISDGKSHIYRKVPQTFIKIYSVAIEIEDCKMWAEAMVKLLAISI